MKLGCSTAVVLTQAGSSVRRGYFDRISQVTERRVLIFVVLLTLLLGYVNHSHLMKDTLLL